MKPRIREVVWTVLAFVGLFFASDPVFVLGPLIMAELCSMQARAARKEDA